MNYWKYEKSKTNKTSQRLLMVQRRAKIQKPCCRAKYLSSGALPAPRCSSGFFWVTQPTKLILLNADFSSSGRGRKRQILTVLSSEHVAIYSTNGVPRVHPMDHWPSELEQLHPTHHSNEGEACSRGYEICPWNKRNSTLFRYSTRAQHLL